MEFNNDESHEVLDQTGNVTQREFTASISSDNSAEKQMQFTTKNETSLDVSIDESKKRDYALNHSNMSHESSL